MVHFLLNNIKCHKTCWIWYHSIALFSSFRMMCDLSWFDHSAQIWAILLDGRFVLYRVSQIQRPLYFCYKIRNNCSLDMKFFFYVVNWWYERCKEKKSKKKFWYDTGTTENEQILEQCYSYFLVFLIDF